ncbi:adenosine receptor A3 isoform X1 [Labrus bergylta]|uniref:Histamine H2 receptor-like n=1 Tax=Labrus bergylta TaxID=56723 RepID=A0A3Q3FVA3_9LABR|nr:histamine H2 receptor-like isoform X1 [Labrus bergylta]XP_029136983.1 histamine H2 receptor-like isoform X1 [Labrus bergylta]
MTDALRMLYAALMVVSGMASVCGNLLLLLVLLLNKELRTDALGLTLSFSLSDLALGLSIIPFGVYNSLSWSSCFASEGALCQGSGFIFLLLQTSSMHSLTWATVNKFTEICFALSYSRVWTGGRSRAMLVLVWLFCLVTAALPLLGFGSYVYSESRFLCCPNFTPEDRCFVLLWMLAGIVAPIITMCSLYGYIVYVATKQARRGTFMCNELHCYYVPANNYLRSSVVMVTTSVCLLVCWLPYISVCLYETFSGEQSPAVTSALSAWLVLTSSALNPWITCMTQTRYRAAVRRLISRFISMFLCSETPLESRPQSAALHLDTANRISTTTRTTAASCPPSSPETTTPP